MKLSYRDKVILIVLLVIIVWVVGVMFFIKPKFEELDDANKELETQNGILAEKQEVIKKDEGLRERVQEAYNNVIKLADVFYDTKISETENRNTPDVSREIDEMLDKFDIENDRLDISQYSTMVLDKVSSAPQRLVTDLDKIADDIHQLGQQIQAADGNVATSNDPKAPTGPVSVPAYTVSFGYKCELDNLKKFFDSLRSNTQRSLVVSSCSIADVKADVVTGEITLVLMMMPRIENPIALNENAQQAAS